MSEGKYAVSQTQRERLAYIELRAFFVGEVRRPDIESRFGIKPAAASRDLAAYKELAPDNLEYDTLARCYRPTPKFVPHFGLSPERIMSWLRNGFGDGLDTRSKSPAQCVGPVTLCAPSLDILATITRAICGKRPLRISYLSVSSGKSDREVVPVALADTGLRWHVRAFDRRNRRFSDFALRRIVMAEPGSDPVADEEKVFGRRVSTEAFSNPRQRPDIMALADATCSIVGTDAFDGGEASLTRIQSVLIIELKKGNSTIGREEVNQATGYVQDFLGSGAMDGTPMFRAFVVGHAIDAKTMRDLEIKDESVVRGRVQATTYGQLTRSAHQRLFRLKDKIPARYEDVSGSELSARVMGLASQADLGLSGGGAE